MISLNNYAGVRQSYIYRALKNAGVFRYAKENPQDRTLLFLQIIYDNIFKEKNIKEL